jgi:capsular exopolysaccharide synthesis family protein
MPNLDPLDLPPPKEFSEASFVVDLHGLFRLILNKSWVIALCVVLAVIAAAVYGEWTPRVYEAVATVQVEQEDAKVVKAEQVVSEDMRGLDILNTVAQKLNNPGLLQTVLEKNNLLPAEGMLMTNGSRTLTREEVLKKFARNVKTTLRRNTRLIDITVQNPNPQMAAQLANSLVENYLGQDALVQSNTTEGANTFLEKEAERQKEKLMKAEQDLQDYRKSVGAVSLLQNQDIVTPKLQDLSKRLTESKANLVQAEGNYKDWLKLSTNVEDLLAQPSIASDPDVQQIATDVARHESDFALIRRRYREKNPKYIMAADSLDGLKQQLAKTVLKVRSRVQETLLIAYQNALTTQHGLETELSDAQATAMQLSDVAVRFDMLSREVKSDQAQFDAIIGRLSETKVVAQLTPERIRVVQKALVPEKPSWPKIRLLFGLALLGGLVLGLAISVVIYSIDTSFRTVDEVERYLGLPVLGSVPKLPKAELEGNKLVALGDREALGAEVFRTLRTTLAMLGPEKDRKTYLFTSSMPSEGKSFTSVNYAASLAQQGLRTLLVDVDLRRPSLEHFFTGKRNQLPGVTDYFLGNKKLTEVSLQHEALSKLFWVPAGSSVPNPAELLTQADFQQLLNEGLANFDRVVVDTAPLLPVSDTLLLANKVQTVVLVVQSCKTSRKAVERSLQMLNKANAPIGGIVLNILPNRPFNDYYYSYYHGYGYGYGHYGRKETGKAAVDA